ncbi:MAG: hypothetical protein B6D34_12335 [Candidatus Brocadia sp. UTAMX1]|nr:MAG: hypothetical protein B6D34_12335 [Candidatus Brocadia sp. UTAMX1]
MHRQVITGDALSIAKSVQTCPQTLESAATLGTLPGYMAMAFHIDVELRFLLRIFTGGLLKIRPTLIKNFLAVPAQKQTLLYANCESRASHIIYTTYDQTFRFPLINSDE